MQYLKLGPMKIPYMIKTEDGKKTFHVGRVKIPFSSFQKEGKKYYRLCGITFTLPGLDKVAITQSKINFLQRGQLTEEKVRQIAQSIFEEKLGYRPNLDEPATFNEKIFWFKLNYHDPLVTVCCDKFAVKEYVTQTLGPGYVVPTIASWDSAEAIDFADLPQRFVMKVNWSSGYNIIVKDKSQLSEEETRQKVHHWMQPQQNSYYQTFNWGYKHMKPVVYAEEYLEQIDGQLYDYKFYCCGGKAEFLFIATDRHKDGKLTYDFFDRDFQHLPLTYGGRGHASPVPQKPKFYEEMVACAEKLAKPFPFVRVDFYETDEGFFVGEMTFYSGGGILPFTPEEWDRKLGAYIPLPEQKREETENGIGL